MMLSQKYINKLHLKGLYKSIAHTLINENEKYSVSNWTLKPVKVNDDYYMKCTVTGNKITLTDENFDNFMCIIKDVDAHIKRQQEIAKRNNGEWIK